MGGLGVSSASLLRLPAFLASAFGAIEILTTIFSETFEDVPFTKALEKWLSLTNEEEEEEEIYLPSGCGSINDFLSLIPEQSK